MNRDGGARLRCPAIAIEVLDLLWPLRCPLCDESLRTGEDGVLDSAGRWPRGLLHARCLGRLERFALRPVRARERPSPTPVHAWLRDGEAVFALLHRAKYEGEPSLLEPLVDTWAREQGRLGLPPRAVLVPLPDDRTRRRARGYGVTERLGRTLSAAWGLRLRCDLLRRRPGGQPQARQPTDAARRHNVRGRFAAGDLASLPRSRALLLVEDQVTSGATVREATAVLGARGHPVAVLALAASARSPRGVKP